MINKIKESSLSTKMIISFVIILFAFLLLQNVGIWTYVSNGVEKLGKNIAGIEKQIVNAGTSSRIALGLMTGVNVEQDIYLTEEMLEAEELMLGIGVTNYQRENDGYMYVQVMQDDLCKVFQLDIEAVKGEGAVTLLLKTADWKEGSLKLKIYTTYSTNANCLGLFVMNNTKNYPPVVINGEETKQNASVDIMVPSIFAKPDFKEVGLEYSKQEEAYEERLILEEVEEFEIYLPESSSNEIYQIALHFLTYNRINTGTLTIRFTQGRSVVTQEIDMSTIQNAQLMLFYLDGKHYDLGPCKVEMFATGATEDNCVATGMTRMTEYTDENGNTPTYLITDIYLLEKQE